MRSVWLVAGCRTVSAVSSLGTPYWELGAGRLATTLLHELGHVFDIVTALGGSAIKYDHSDALQEANAKALEKCKL